MAYFGGKEKYDAIAKDWKHFCLLNENKGENGELLSFEGLKNRENALQIDHFFDIDNANVSLEDLKNVAKAHGGKLLSKNFSGLNDKLEWQNSDGETFEARPYTVLFAGHWMNPTYTQNAWDFDRLAKTDKIYAQVWYDSHEKDEDNFYFYDKDFNARMKKI